MARIWGSTGSLQVEHHQMLADEHIWYKMALKKMQIEFTKNSYVMVCQYIQWKYNNIIHQEIVSFDL